MPEDLVYVSDQFVYVQPPVQSAFSSVLMNLLLNDKWVSVPLRYLLTSVVDCNFIRMIFSQPV